MNNISNIAKGVLIGDGALAAFIEIGRNKNCGVGLFDYTTNNGLRKLNTFNNNPRTASYYSTLEKVENTPMSFKRYLGGNLVSAYNVDGLDIGWAYTTDVNNHRFSQGYASSADFESFQKLLRERYFSNRKDGKPQINNVILEHGDVNSTKPGVGTVDSRLFTEIDFSLPIGKSETELLTFNFKNGGITDNVESIIEFNKYDYTKQYLGRQSSKDIYKVKYISKTDHLSYNETKISSNYNDSRDAFIDGNGTEYGGVTIGNNEDIVAYTKKLFKDKKIGTLVNRSSNDGVNRGRKLREGSYCRVWTPTRQYSKISDLIRPNGGNTYENLQKKLSDSMRPNDGSTRLIENSVLQENGFVRITPTSTIGEKSDNIKNYMFSIENLAWKDNKHELSDEQKGPNDGRIMWFPPYNLKFSENINVNWNGNSFIGRGEQIYTYTNTERSGTLDFTLLIDHPSILNEWRGRQDMGDNKDYERDLLYFFTGCDTLNMENKPKILKEEISQPLSNKPNIERKPAPETIQKLLIIYFPNAFSGQDYNDVDDALLKLYSYEMDDSGEEIDIIDNKYSESSNNNTNSLSLNKNKKLTNSKNKFKDFKEEDIFTLNDLISVKRGDKKVLDYDKLDKVGVYYEGKCIFSISRADWEEHRFSDEDGNEFFIIEENPPKSIDGFYQLTLNNIKINNYIFDFKYDSSSKDIDVYYNNNYITTLKYDYDIIGDEEAYWDENATNDNYLYFSIEEDEDGEVKVIPIDIDDWLKYTFKYKVPCEDLDNTIIIDYVNYDISEELLGEMAFGINQSDYEISKQIIYGGASSHGSETTNKELAKKRANLLVKVLNKIGLHLVDYRYKEDLIDVKGDDINSKEAKLARYGAIVLEYKQKNNSPSNDSSTTSMIGKDANSTGESAPREATIVEEVDVKYSFDNEYLYFENIGKNENMVSNILKRVRHFDPAFHSITPEGFNARLTFLHQCTRQGPTSAVNSGQFNTESNNYLKYAGNLSFGRAPYCILRIGDFFNTKIMIESISINYDNSGGLQWDLNPEGAGVQPMLANISMNFKFLGGQDIAGPIEKLQNAISSNYYANASIYDIKAEINKEKK